MNDNLLPSEAIEALRRGNKIEAIKIVRERSGLGLKQAKDAVEAFERSGVNPAWSATDASQAHQALPHGIPTSIAALPQQVVELLQRGDFLQAIKLLRSLSGADLKAAKDAVDAYRQERPDLHAMPTPPATRRGPARRSEDVSGSAIQEGGGSSRVMILGVLVALILLGVLLLAVL